MSSIIVTDPQLLEQLTGVDGSVDMTGPDGRHLGTFSSDAVFGLPPGAKIPFTAEELAERRKLSTGVPLADVLQELDGLKAK